MQFKLLVLILRYVNGLAVAARGVSPGGENLHTFSVIAEYVNVHSWRL